MAIAGGLLGEKELTWLYLEGYWERKNLRGYSWRVTGRGRTYVAIAGGLLGENELTWL